jgi:hypothetical protein
VGVAVRLAIDLRQRIGGMVRVGDVLPDAGVKDGRKASTCARLTYVPNKPEPRERNPSKTSRGPCPVPFRF